MRPRWRGASRDGSLLDGAPDLGFDLGDSVFGAIAAVLAIIALAALLAFYVLPLAILLLEVLIFLVLATAGLFGRVALRRPWRLEARSEWTRLEWSVAGWRDSRDALEAIAVALERGRLPEAPLPAPHRTVARR